MGVAPDMPFEVAHALAKIAAHALERDDVYRIIYNTSQECSGCGWLVPKKLGVRWHKCECGCSLDRDHNAAINILNRAVNGPQGSRWGTSFRG